MAGQGQKVMTQAQLNLALNWACSQLSDPARAEELLGRGADQHALVEGWNVLHVAASHGRAATVNMLLDKGAVLDARDAEGNTALLWAAFRDGPEICKLLIERGADLRVLNDNDKSAFTHYGLRKNIDPSVKAQRREELKAWFRAGPHPSQVQRRKEEAWEKRWPLMNVAYGCGSFVLQHKAAQLKAAALATDARRAHGDSSDDGDSDES